MGLWKIAEYGAWIVSAALFLWMFVDMIRVNRSFGEDLLLSSREGVDELFAEPGQGDAKKGS
jgi:hypothetical protein